MLDLLPLPATARGTRHGVRHLNAWADRATYTKPAQRSKGIEFVMVNGTLVVDGGEIVNGVNPGRGVKAQ